MLGRLYLVFFLAFFISSGYAGQANWNCRQDPKTKAWNCVGSSAPVESAGSEIPPQSEQPAVQIEKSDELESIDKTKELNTETSDLKAPPSAPLAPVAKPSAQTITGHKLTNPETPKQEDEAPAPAASISETPPKVLSASEKPKPVGTKPSSTGDVKQSGWRCDNKGDEGKWNCQLVGSDPKGESHTVEAEGESFSLLNSGFDNQEERVFGVLRDRFKNNPWANCSIQVGTQKYYLPDKKLREKADVDMDSNYAEVYDNEVGTYEGSVEMKRADQRASSHAANYDTVSGNLDLHGDVYYSEDEVALHTESATLKLDNDQAKLRDALFISPVTPLRGRAAAFFRDSPSLSRFKDASYTSCQPGNQDWIVHASDLKLNKASGYGSAKNAWLEFKGVPVFYSPYLSFPMDDRRLTGFLAPEFGNTQKGGFSFGAPFYWNIAPNYDATLRPRYFLDRGIMFGGNFRYLTEMTKGDVSLEYMPDDSLVNQPRYQGSITNSTRFNQNVNANLDLNIVSDKEYFRDLGNALSFPNFSFIKSTADIAYNNEGVSLTGQLINYQTIDPAIRGRARPYRQLPKVNLNLDHVFETSLVPVKTAMDSEYVYFQHDEGNLPDGHRLNFKPSVSLPLKTSAAYVTPKFTLQHTQYELNTPRSGISDSIGRTLPILSIDSGAFLEKDLKMLEGSYLHTLEPRLFYLFIPKENQDNIPIFDTSLYDFWFDSLFRENRYNSIDRVQEANQVSAALTSRVVDSESGLEKLKLRIGETFFFRDREVVGPMVRIGQTFINDPVDRSFFSPLVVELSSELNKHVSIDTGLQWDFNRNESVRGKAFLHLENEPGEIINLGYTYRKSFLIEDALNQSIDNLGVIDPNDKAQLAQFNLLNRFLNDNKIIRSSDIIQSDISFRWPIYDNWFAIGRWQYSLLFNQSQDTFLGVEKENCCWRFRFVGRRFVNNIRAANNAIITPTGDPYTSQTGIFFQVEFKGLTGISNVDVDEFLSRSIYGYEPPPP